jgi:hypothetical protein
VLKIFAAAVDIGLPHPSFRYPAIRKRSDDLEKARCVMQAMMEIMKIVIAGLPCWPPMTHVRENRA